MRNAHFKDIHLSTLNCLQSTASKTEVTATQLPPDYPTFDFINIYTSISYHNITWPFQFPFDLRGLHHITTNEYRREWRHSKPTARAQTQPTFDIAISVARVFVSYVYAALPSLP